MLSNPRTIQRPPNGGAVASLPRPPKDWPAARGEAVKQDDAIAAAKSYLDTRDDEIDFAMLCGSCSRGDGSFWSDIDLYVVAPSYGRPSREQTVFQGFALQIGRLSLSESHALIERGRRSGDPFYIHGFAESLQIAGTPDHFASLKLAASGTLAAGPQPYPGWRIERARVAMINGYMKCLKAEGGYTGLSNAIAVTGRFIEYWQLVHGTWLYPERWAVDKGRVPASIMLELEDTILRIPSEGCGAFLDRLSGTLDKMSSFSWSTDGCGPLPM